MISFIYNENVEAPERKLGERRNPRQPFQPWGPILVVCEPNLRYKKDQLLSIPLIP